jgi:negative regulator of flagellin synthesis FlgM
MSPVASPTDRLKATATVPVAGVGGGVNARASEGAGQAAGTAPVNRANAQGVSVELKASVAASQPPVDSGRVAEIRAALRDGSYPVLPVKIADAMIAARLALGLGE